MIINSNMHDKNTDFTGYYHCSMTQMSKDTQVLAKQSSEVIKNAKNYLTKLQSIDCGNYTLSNYEKPSKISPVLSAKVDNNDVKMSEYMDGFNLQINNGDDTDVLTFWGGDVLEFESTKHPLKSSEFPLLEGKLLENVDNILKKCLTLFTVKQ